MIKGFKGVNRGIIISIVSILSLSMLQGCSSMDRTINTINVEYQRGYRSWDPPGGFSYGDQIPNMRGDYDRFCPQAERWRCG